MARKFPLCGIYRITNNLNGKVYIGESVNILDRKSYYAHSHARKLHDGGFQRLIEHAIVLYGWENFTFEVLVDHMDDPRLIDDVYRRNMEVEFISKYDSANPSKGYNINSDMNYSGLNSFSRNHRVGVKHTDETKLKKSDLIFVYDENDGTTVMYLSKKAFALFLRIDRSIVARASKNGKKVRHYRVFMVDPEKRFKYAKDIVEHKLICNSTNGLAEKSLKDYMKALSAVDDYAALTGYSRIDINELKRVIKKYGKN